MARCKPIIPQAQPAAILTAMLCRGHRLQDIAATRFDGATETTVATLTPVGD